MATIRERNGSYTAMVRKAGHPTLTRTFNSKRKAERWAAGQEARIEEGDVFDSPTRYTLGEAIDRYLEDPDRTLKKYQKGVLEWWRDTAQNRQGVILGKKRLQQLRRSDFIDARDMLRNMEARSGGLSVSYTHLTLPTTPYV